MDRRLLLRFARGWRPVLGVLLLAGCAGSPLHPAITATAPHGAVPVPLSTSTSAAIPISSPVATAAPTAPPQAFGPLPRASTQVDPARGTALGVSTKTPDGLPGVVVRDQEGSGGWILHPIPPAAAARIYTVATPPTIPAAATVYRLRTGDTGEQAVRDLAAKAGMTGTLQVTRRASGPDWTWTAVAGTAPDAEAHAPVFYLSSRGDFEYRIGADREAQLRRAGGTDPNDRAARAVATDFLRRLDLLTSLASAITIHPFRAPPPAGQSATPYTGWTVRIAFQPPTGAQATDEWVGETVTVGPNDTVISASGIALSLAAASDYPLLPVGDLVAALQGGKAFGTATLPTGERVPTSGQTPPGMFDVAQPFTVEVTIAVIGYVLVYSDDRTPYWEPVVIFQGMVCQAGVGAGAAPIFTGWVDALAP